MLPENVRITEDWLISSTIEWQLLVGTVIIKFMRFKELSHYVFQPNQFESWVAKLRKRRISLAKLQ